MVRFCCGERKSTLSAIKESISAIVVDFNERKQVLLGKYFKLAIVFDLFKAKYLVGNKIDFRKII